MYNITYCTVKVKKKMLEYKKDYFGYVYLWYDHKRKMYYLGGHYGSVDDSYICSSVHMLRAYKKRPQDFKMRILKYVEDDKSLLLEQEQRYLDMMDNTKLSTPKNRRTNTVRYYNVKKSATGGKESRLKYRKFNCAYCGCLSTTKEEDRKYCQAECYYKDKKGWPAQNKGSTHTQKTKDIISQKNKGKRPWNKGLPNPQAAENGRKGAKKQSEVVTGRKRQYRDDGTWFWVYPDRKKD